MPSEHTANFSIRAATAIILLWSWCFGMMACEAAGQTSETPVPVRPLFGLSVRKSVLEQRFKRTRSEREGVSKSLMNSNVTGNQTTVTETRLRIIPDEKTLKFELLNSGDVTSQTTGFNPQATVDSVGKHHFEIIKPLWFDGSVFLTLPAHGTIQASQTPQRVTSAAGAAMPLLGPLSDRVAWNEVLRRTPQINQVVAEDVSRDVLPKIDRIVDSDFAEFQRQWKSIQGKMKTVFRETMLTWSARSTQESVSIWTEVEHVQRRQAVSAVPNEASAFRSDEAVVCFLSEDAVDALLKEYFPAGLKITDTQLQDIQLPAAMENPGQPFSISQMVSLLAQLRRTSEAEAGLFTLEFAVEDPIKVRFVDGDVRITTTFQIHPKAGASSGWMSTSFNLRGKRFSDQQWMIAVRSVEVGEEGLEASGIAAESVGPDEVPLRIPSATGEPVRDNPPADDADVTTVQAGTAWIPIIRNAAQSLAEKLPPVKLPLEFEGSEIVPGSPRFRLGKIDSANGMLRVGLRIVNSEPAAAGLKTP